MTTTTRFATALMKASVPAIMSATAPTRIRAASIQGAIGTGLSRLLGLARDMAIGHVMGAGRSADIFWIAFTVPNVFRRLVADEGLTGVLIPTVEKAEQQAGLAEAKRLAAAALASLLLVGLAICVLVIALAPWVVRLVAYGFTAEREKFELTVSLTRWLIPFVVLVSLVSYCEGLLNRRGHFFIPKAAPGIVSAGIAVGALYGTSYFTQPLNALVAGTLVGGVVHLLVCIPPLLRLWGLTLPLLSAMKGPRFRAFVAEMGKVAAIGVIGQAHILVLRQLAAVLAEGSVSHFWYASRIVDALQAAVAMAVASALLPLIAADVAARKWRIFRHHFATATQLVSLWLLPAAALLVALALPIVTVLFQHGAFDRYACEKTAATLQMLVPFMLAFGAIHLCKRAYYALDDRSTLFWTGIGCVVLTGFLGHGLAMKMGVAGLGLGLSIATASELLVLIILLRQKVEGRLGLRKLVAPVTKASLAAAVAGWLAYGISQWGQWQLGSASVRNWLVLAFAASSGIGLYLGLLRLLKIPRKPSDAATSDPGSSPGR